MAATEPDPRKRRWVAAVSVSVVLVAFAGFGFWRWAQSQREHNLTDSCQVNLKGIALGLQMYLTDWDEKLPPGDDGDPYYWVDAIYLAQPRKYPDMGRYFSMWRTPMTVFCPKHVPQEETIGQAARRPGNEFWALIASDPQRYLSYTGIGSMAGQSVVHIEDATGMRRSEIPFVFDTVPRHLGGRNVVTLGTSVRWMSEREFSSALNYLRKSVEAGEETDP